MTDVAKPQESCNNAGVETVARQQAISAKGETVQLIDTNTELQHPLDGVEAAMLDMPQIDCPVQHYFGPGIYIREAFLPAGTYVMGHSHKSEHMNVMLKGKMAVIVNGEARVIEGPLIFTGEPGRKFAYIIEDTVFQNIYATTETDIDVIEDMFVDKSAAWLDADALRHNEGLIAGAVHQYLEGVAQ